MAHIIYSQSEEMPIKFFDAFDKEVIRTEIIKHLSNNPTDVVELCKEYSQKDLKRYKGYNIISFYGINPKNGKPSLIITKNNREYYKSLIN